MSLEKIVGNRAFVPIAVGILSAGAGFAAGYWYRGRNVEDLEAEYDEVEEDRDEPVTLVSTEVPEKPPITMYGVMGTYQLVDHQEDMVEEVASNPEGVLTEIIGKYESKGRQLSAEEFMDWPQENAKVATWFIDDEILAGEDDLLDQLDPEEIHGGLPEDVILTLKSGVVSGVYALCNDGETAMEIVVSHGNYLEEYEALVAAQAEEIAREEGYSEAAHASHVTYAPRRRRR